MAVQGLGTFGNEGNAMEICKRRTNVNVKQSEVSPWHGMPPGVAPRVLLRGCVEVAAQPHLRPGFLWARLLQLRETRCSGTFNYLSLKSKR